MNIWSRRRAIFGAAATIASPLFFKNGKAAIAAGEEASQSVSVAAARNPRPLVHVTDLFRPHGDPDDHWDLATVYAMACRGDLELLGILTDNPRNLPAVYTDARSPDVAAVAQLNYLSDRAVPVATGTIWPGKPGEKVREDNLPKELRGVNMLLNILKQSPQPVAITVVGSCQDVAIAGKKEPGLFSEKCAAIYVNAGAGSQNPTEQSVDGHVEWNAGLNRGAYATMFELPCPIYWMPDVYGLSKTYATSGEYISGDYATMWTFRHKEILPYLSNRLQAYFAYMLSKESGTNWLPYLLDPASKNSAQEYLDDERAMWSTAGFLHAAGKTVTSDGQIVSLGVAKEKEIFEFVPIEVRCDANGITKWDKTGSHTTRYIFRVKDKDRYANAMMRALKSLLRELP